MVADEAVLKKVHKKKNFKNSFFSCPLTKMFCETFAHRYYLFKNKFNTSSLAIDGMAYTDLLISILNGMTIGLTSTSLMSEGYFIQHSVLLYLIHYILLCSYILYTPERDPLSDRRKMCFPSNRSRLEMG
jgi:hypothetical protein